MYKRIIKTIINTNGLHKRKEGKIGRFLMRLVLQSGKEQRESEQKQK